MRHALGRSHKNVEHGRRALLEPRASFKVWYEAVAGSCRVWTDERLEMAGMLALVYGKVCYSIGCLIVSTLDGLFHSSPKPGRRREREKETTELTNTLFSNAGYEGGRLVPIQPSERFLKGMTARAPLNHIIK